MTADGISIVLSGAPAAGDQFLIQPTATAASHRSSVVLTDPSKIAAAGAVQAAAVGQQYRRMPRSAARTVLDSTNPNLLTPATIAFTSPTTYTINGGAANAYTSGGNIDLNGWQVQISGAPAAGDSFTVTSNAGGTGDNRNALISGQSAKRRRAQNGTTSITGGVSALDHRAWAARRSRSTRRKPRKRR